MVHFHFRFLALAHQIRYHAQERGSSGIAKKVETACCFGLSHQPIPSYDGSRGAYGAGYVAELVNFDFDC